MKPLPGNPALCAAIFDFDETIIDLEPEHAAACDRLCQIMGNDYLSLPESFRNASGKRVVDDVRDMKQAFGWTQSMEELFAMRQRAFDEVCADADLTLMPGSERTIRVFHAAGIPMAITTSAVRTSIEIILRRFALDGLFRIIVDGSDVHHAKPHPEAYLTTAARLGFDTASCLVFEDSTVGVQAAKAAGMFCIAVRNPNARMLQDLSAADRVVESFEEVDAEELVSRE